jgi:adaptin ear-binding coat-associated protein 1/2
LYTVYKIPPLKKNEGHRAGDWGDLASPLWKGRLRIVEKSSGAALLFEDGVTGAFPSSLLLPFMHSELPLFRRMYGLYLFRGDPSITDRTRGVFARADYDPTKPPVEAVLDSSRYFVVRLEEGGKKAFIGMGFAERTDSFDFSTSVITGFAIRLFTLAQTSLSRIMAGPIS